jgi:riboflavin synthase
MFTGLIEELGTISALEKEGSNLNIQISCSKVLSDIELGASIAIDGVCQTVTKFDDKSFWVTAIKETLDLTNFHQLQISSKVNLERCLRPQDRLGGHIVQGHVDSMASLERVDTLDGSYELYFKIEPKASRYIIYKGSIAINGISLTVAGIDETILKVCIIPKTWELTNLAQLKLGQKVNIEVDQVAKYIEKLVATGLTSLA